ncbi:MAG: 30S ribosomal protein S12 methylthiotransferase RimO [Spirochaetales bacterium]
MGTGIHPGKKFYIENLGCAKNLVDGESLAGMLMQAGWEWVEDPEDAEYILVNSCGFIGPAKEESIDVTLQFRNRFPSKKIILAGCLSQRYGEELFRQLPEVDGVFGNRDLSKIVEIVRRIEGGKKDLLLPQQYGSSPSRPVRPAYPGSTYIKVAEGCRNRCSYCAIPLIRGDLRSRPEGEILEEMDAFLQAGIREFNLIAQDLGSYGRDRGEEDGLIPLLRRVQALPGDFWVRLLYIHPEHFPMEVLELCREDRRILPYFDLPFQHASPQILQAMGRRKDARENLRLIEAIRSALPDAVIRSTMLVGFPGETEEDFEELLRFQAEARFDWLGVFTYSREEGTPAAVLDRKRSLHVKRSVALDRKRRIEEAQQEITFGKLDRFVGQKLDVLVEERVEGEGLSLGRGYLHAPEVDGLVVIHHRTAEPGQIVPVQIIRRNGMDLEGVALQREISHG